MAASEPVRIYEGELFSTYGRAINQIRSGGEVVVSGHAPGHLNLWARHFTTTQASRLPQVLSGGIDSTGFAGGGRLRTTAEDVFDIVAEHGLRPRDGRRPMILTSGPETDVRAMSQELSKELAIVGVVNGILEHGVREWAAAYSWVGYYLTGQEHAQLVMGGWEGDCVNDGIVQAANQLTINHYEQMTESFGGPGRPDDPMELLERLPVLPTGQTLDDELVPFVVRPPLTPHTSHQIMGPGVY